MVTSGSQASGETGLNTWISGLMAAFTWRFSPMMMPSGTAITVARRKPASTVPRLVTIWSKKVGAPG